MIGRAELFEFFERADIAGTLVFIENVWDIEKENIKKTPIGEVLDTPTMTIIRPNEEFNKKLKERLGSQKKIKQIIVTGNRTLIEREGEVSLERAKIWIVKTKDLCKIVPEIGVVIL